VKSLLNLARPFFQVDVKRDNPHKCEDRSDTGTIPAPKSLTAKYRLQRNDGMQF